jgi:iron(III) transport system ATP-binding protein
MAPDAFPLSAPDAPGDTMAGWGRERAVPQGEGPARLEVAGVSRRFGRTLVLDRVSLSLAAGEILVVLGASGCGKSTLLRLVAGLDRPDAGTVRVDGRVLAGPGIDVPAEARGIGLMFQDYALFPHLTVLANVRFGLNRLPAEESRAVALERLREVGLAQRAESYPGDLSGGEAQRVALARSLAPRPRVLLLDEPFSNLDAGTRERVRADTVAVLRRTGTSAILVTHDAAEAVEVADRIALMRGGRFVQAGTAESLYRAPESPFAARALGAIVEIPGRATGGRIETPLGPLPAPPAIPRGAVRVCLRPEAIRLLPAGEGVPARVLKMGFAGHAVRLDLAVEGLDAPLRITVPPECEATQTVGLALVAERALVFAGAEDGATDTA